MSDNLVGKFFYTFSWNNLDLWMKGHVLRQLDDNTFEVEFYKWGPKLEVLSIDKVDRATMKAAHWKFYDTPAEWIMGWEDEWRRINAHLAYLGMVQPTANDLVN